MRAWRALAARTLGAMDIEVLSWADLVVRAGSRAKARTLLSTGRWRKLLRDAYVPAWVPDGPQAKVAALRSVLPADVAVSHRAALWLYGVDVLGAHLDVTVGRGRHLERRPGVIPHSADLADRDLCEVGGLLVVSAARAVVDVARHESIVEAVAVADAVLRAGAATLDGVLEVLEGSAGLRGVQAARLVVPHVEPRSESLMESRFRMRLVLGGVSRPQAQWDVYTDEGHLGRGDLHLEGVLLEYDGRRQRLDKDVFVEERRRQTRIVETGLELRRFTSHDVYVRPAAAVCAEVLRAVSQARGRDRSALRAGPDTLRAPRLSVQSTLSQQRAAAAAAAAAA